jgi:hypothetical protein
MIDPRGGDYGESDVVLELSPHSKLKPRACWLGVDPDRAYITCHTTFTMAPRLPLFIDKTIRYITDAGREFVFIAPYLRWN